MMDYSILKQSSLFKGLPAANLNTALDSTPHHIKDYAKGEIIFHLMESAAYIGILLKGRIQAQKPFPNGSQINVSVFEPGDIIGPAAAFSNNQKYPCDIVALEPVRLMLIHREDLMTLMQKDISILRNFTRVLASSTYMLQQRLELLSYKGIAQKAAFWLLTQERQTGKDEIHIPDSVSKWAMLMNVSRPSLHRELKKMEEAGIISYTPPVIIINDFEALQDVLSQ